MTTRRYFSNTASTLTLATGITSGAVTVSVTSFSGWPTSFPFTATLDYGTSSLEIVLVTAIAGSSATITRGQGGTTAQAHLAGATFDVTPVAQDFDEASAHTSANTGVHGVTGSVVGTTDVQTLSNKNFVGTTTLATVAATTANVTGTATLGTANVTTLNSSASTVTNGVTAANVTAILNPKSFTNEAAASAATTALGAIAYLSAPTTVGYVAGVYSWNGTVWVPHGQPPSTRNWVNTRTGVSDNFSSGSFVSLFSVSLPSTARAGAYLLSTNFTLGTSVTTSGNLRVVDPNGNNISSDLTINPIVSGNRTQVNYSGVSFTWAGGAGTVQVSMFTSTGTTTIFNAGARLDVAFLGA